MSRSKSEATTLVVGASGQDGVLLTELLQAAGNRVIQIGRDFIFDGVIRRTFTSTDIDQVKEVFNRYSPKEVYFLATNHSPSDSHISDEKLLLDYVHSQISFLNMYLESSLSLGRETRFFFASSCLVFGSPNVSPQNETTLRAPVGMYSLSKLFSEELVKYYRDSFGLYALTGILFPHESEFRRQDFLFSKILRHSIEVSQGSYSTLKLNNLDVARDWSAARDIVNAIYMSMQQPDPRDYVIGGGQLHTVREICELAFSYHNLNYQEWVEEDPETLVRANPELPYLADTSLLRKHTSWFPKIDFNDLVNSSIKYLESEGAPK